MFNFIGILHHQLIFLPEFQQIVNLFSLMILWYILYYHFLLGFMNIDRYIFQYFFLISLLRFMVLKIYIDHASQPSRAVYAFCLLLKIPHQVHELRVIEGDHLKEDYVKINPLKMVPSIDDDGFYLGQSHAILKYLAKKYSKTDNWYPTNNYKKCAIVDEYLAFHSNNTRQCAKLTFLTGFAKYIDKRRSNFQVAHYEKKTVESELRQNVDTTLKLIESIYLKTTKFIGSDQISIADISAYCEIKQMEFINFEYPKYEKIWAWMKRMEQIKQINEVHVKFNIISVKIKEKRKNFKEQTA